MPAENEDTVLETRFGSRAAKLLPKRSRPDEFLNADTRFEEKPTARFLLELRARVEEFHSNAGSGCDCDSLQDFLSSLDESY